MQFFLFFYLSTNPQLSYEEFFDLCRQDPIYHELFPALQEDDSTLVWRMPRILNKTKLELFNPWHLNADILKGADLYKYTFSLLKWKMKGIPV